MTVRETAGQATPHGAGRFMDIIGQMEAAGVVVGTAGSLHGRARGGVDSNGFLEAGTTVGGATFTLQRRHMRMLNRFAGAQRISRPIRFGVNPLTVRPNSTSGLYRPLDVFQVWRIMALMCVDTIVGLTAMDTGLVCIVSPNTAGGTAHSVAMFADAAAQGFGIVLNAAGDWRFRVNNGGGAGVYSVDTSLGIADATELNAFEMRIFSATRHLEARVEVWANGREVTRQLWGAGTLLPVIAAPSLFYQANIRSGNHAPNLFWALRFMMGPDGPGMFDS